MCAREEWMRDDDKEDLVCLALQISHLTVSLLLRRDASDNQTLSMRDEEAVPLQKIRISLTVFVGAAK